MSEQIIQSKSITYIQKLVYSKETVEKRFSSGFLYSSVLQIQQVELLICWALIPHTILAGFFKQKTGKATQKYRQLN